MNDLSAFIALWDKRIGAKIMDFYPKSSQPKFDLEFISSKIFFAFQNLNQDDAITKIKKTSRIPFLFKHVQTIRFVFPCNF